MLITDLVQDTQILQDRLNIRGHTAYEPLAPVVRRAAAGPATICLPSMRVRKKISIVVFGVGTTYDLSVFRSSTNDHPNTHSSVASDFTFLYTLF